MGPMSRWVGAGRISAGQASGLGPQDPDPIPIRNLRSEV